MNAHQPISWINVVLVEPEIPPNTGNVIRLCANTGCALHLIEPLGFDLDDRQLRRAGLDYHEYASLQVHKDWSGFIARCQPDPQRLWAFTTKGSRSFAEPSFQAGDWLVFGAETRGLPDVVRGAIAAEQCLRLPMRSGQRSLNLSNSVAVAVFEAWRQNGFCGAA
jgi:tRNA (cytidine/uridine-2'-O-)-methyltransferase